MNIMKNNGLSLGLSRSVLYDKVNPGNLTSACMYLHWSPVSPLRFIDTL